MQNVVTRTPLRITFSGGGSDLPFFYEKHTGAVLNATIDKHVYIFLHKSFDDNFRVRYSENEIASSVDEIKHPLVRESLKFLRINEPIEIISLADVTSKGSGLGSSASYTVGLLNALHAWKGNVVTREQLADEAVYVEMDLVKNETGLQDQYAASFGGFNLFEIKNRHFVSRNLVIFDGVIQSLQSSLALYYTGITRDANGILESVRKNHDFDSMLLRRDMAYAHYRDMCNGNWQNTGEYLSSGRKLKSKTSADTTNSELDVLCNKIEDMGAHVKNIGAGGGGFLLVFAEKTIQDRIRSELNLRELPFRFEFNGSSIIYCD